MKARIKMFKKLNLDRKYDGKVHTCQQYFELPKEEREVKKWYWPTKLFLWPFAMSAGYDWASEDLNIEKVFFSEWEKFYDQIRKEYPIQSFFRLFHNTEFYRFFSHRYYRVLIDGYYPVKNFFFRRNKFLTKLIPNGYKNEAVLMEELLYAFFLKVYDAGIDGWRDPKDEIWSAHAKKFDMCARWIKVEKPELLIKAEKAMDKASSLRKNGLSYQERYGEVDAIEKEIEDKTTQWMTYIIESRDLLN